MTITTTTNRKTNDVLFLKPKPKRPVKKMKVLKLEVRTRNDIDTIEKMLMIFMAMNNIRLCASELTILATLIHYRPTTKTRKYIMNDMKLYKRKTSFHNAIYKFKKLGLVSTDEHGTMSINSKIDVDDGKIGIILKLIPKN